MNKRLVIFLFCFLLIPFSNIFASLGVGIGTSRIAVSEELKNGMEYKFPELVVMNTGDETSVYTVDISYDADQKALLPPREWFTFTPLEFELESGESQIVEIRLKLPIKDVVPGDYFAYLEGKPVRRSDDGRTSVGISAAARLTFYIAPSNIFEAVYYALRNIWLQYQPWSIIVSSALGLLLLKTVFTKFFSLNLNVKLRKKDNQKNTKDE